MGFAAPWFLAGVAAIALPVWLHLLRRHRSNPVRFSSLMFFEPHTQSSIKHRRLRYLLLFALRAALLALLALAFAGPFLTTNTDPAASERRLVVLAIDNSFSMRQGNRLDRAKQDAARTLEGLRSGERAQVIAFAGQVRVMTDAEADAGALRGAVSAIGPTDERGSYAEVVRAVRSIAKAAGGSVELHVFSDFQRSSWPDNFNDVRLPAGVRLVAHRSADGALPNLAVESVQAPARLYGEGRARIQAVVASFGAERATRRVSLLLNGREMAGKSVDVAPGGRASVEFDAIEAPYGRNRGEVRIDSGDAFPADDVFYFGTERTDPRQVLFVHDARNARDVLYFRAALEAAAGGAFHLDVVPAGEAGSRDPAKYAFIVLSDAPGLPPVFESALREYVRKGGSLWIALGLTAAGQSRVPIFDAPIRRAQYASREGELFEGVSSLDATHPSLRHSGSWDGVRFFQTVGVEPGPARVVARLSNDAPLLVEKRVGEGRVLVFASTFDNISNDFPVHPGFVPFVDETARYLAGTDTAAASVTVGSWLELGRRREQGASAEVLDPRGARVLSLAESTRARSVQLATAGFYDVRRPNSGGELVAVNPDRRESDLSVVPADTLALWQNSGGRAPADAGAAESGPRRVDLWWYVLLAALLVAVAESLIGNDHLAADKEAG